MSRRVSFGRVWASMACLAALALGTARALAWSRRPAPVHSAPCAISPPQLPSQQSTAPLINQTPARTPCQAEPAGLPAATRTRPISLEKHADILLARKEYADAVDYYLRALRQGGSKEAYLWNKLGIAYQLDMN